MTEILAVIFFIALGLAFGSFANVCAFRIPENISVVSPGSFCPVCRAKISWRDNVPIFSYIMLGGRCRACRAKISWRYPAVETLTAALFAAVYLKTGFAPALPGFLLFAWALVVASAADLRTRIIPDEFSVGAAAMGIAASPANFFFDGVWYWRAAQSVSGAFAGLVLGLAVAWLGEKIFRRESFGGGDVKLLAACGAYLGIAGAFWTLFYASLAGSAVSLFLIALKKISKDDYVPFGPFLAAGGLAVFFIK